MKERWNFNNPREAFLAYEADVRRYELKKKEADRLDAQLEGLKKNLDKTKKEKEKLESRQPGDRGSYQPELEARNKKEADRSAKLLSAEAKAYELARADILKEQNTEQEKAAAYNQARMERLSQSESLSLDQLSPRAEKALEIEEERQAFYDEAASRRRAEELAHIDEQRSAEAEIGAIEGEITALIADYQPKLAQIRRDIEIKIEEKEAELLKYNQSLAEEEALRERDLYAFELEKERLNLLPSGSDEGIEALSSHKVRLEAAEKSSVESIGARKSELQSALAESEAALGHLKSELGKLIDERDAKIKELDTRIQELRKLEAEKQAKFAGKIKEEEKRIHDKEEELEKKILSYARSQGIDHSDNYDILLGRFKSLQARTGLWKSLISEIELKNREQVYEVELVKQRQILDKLSYDDLERELSKAEKFKDRLGPIAKKPFPYAIFGAFVSVFGLVVLGLSFLQGIRNPKLQMAGGIVMIILGLVFLFYVLTKPKKDVRRLCRFISLSEDNESFDAIEERAISDAEDQEVAGLKELGELIWLKKQGPEGLAAEKAKKETGLAAYYEAKNLVLEQSYENKKAEIDRARRLEELKHEHKLFLEISKLDLSKLSHFKELSFVQKELVSMEELGEGLNSIKQGLAAEIEGFEANYSEFLNKLRDDAWTLPEGEAAQGLEQELFLVEGEKGAGPNQLLDILRLNTKQAPLLVSYDNYLLNYDVKLMPDGLAELIMDLVKAFYRMNGSKSMAQYVYGEVEGLKAAMVKEGAFKLAKVMEGPEDMEALETQAEADYNILYYVFKPQDAEGRIEEGLLDKLRARSRKALLPVYIAYRGAVEDAKRAEGSEYTGYLAEAEGLVRYSNAAYQLEEKVK